jgi:parallel beta-helix repeat protein
VYAESSDLSITKCIVQGNEYHGIYTYQGKPTIKNNWIYKNGTTYTLGHGIYLQGAEPETVVRNNTVVDNTGYGIHGSTSHHITNCIVWGNWDNKSPQVVDCTASYSCIEGDPVYTGNGNINTDPCFVNTTDTNNYHLDPNSACIDAGDPNFEAGPNEVDIDWEERVFDGNENGIKRVDMGADEFYWSPADFNDDKIVNFLDYDVLASAWQTEDANVSLDDDNDVDYNDLDLFCEDWLWEPAWTKGAEEMRMMMGGGGMERGEGFGEGIYSPAPAQEQAMESESEEAEELGPERIKELIEWLEGILVDEEMKKLIGEKNWDEFVKGVKGIIESLKEELEE